MEKKTDERRVYVNGVCKIETYRAIILVFFQNSRILWNFFKGDLPGKCPCPLVIQGLPPKPGVYFYPAGIYIEISLSRI